ncbi:MAG: rhomboid family intramembrane serine protease [Pirellulaceae bacterium]|nr:rhomboid family intramembrane serine protease [Pirellulaceae bacterium]
MGIYDRHYYSDNLENMSFSWSSRSIISTIIIINVLVQVIELFLGHENSLSQLLWLKAEHLGQPLHWYRFLTYGFVHSPDIKHILFNMAALFFLGQAVEQKYGRWEFLRFYLTTLVVCGVAWAISHVIEQNHSVVLIGASGAVTAVSMLFVFAHPTSVLRIWGIIPVRAWVVGVMIVASNLLGNLRVDVNNTTQVAYDVHLYGALFAAVYFFAKFDLSFMGDWWSKLVWRLPKRRPKLKVHNPAGRRPDVSQRAQAEADRILDKIHREGQDSLTVKERKFIEDYSQQLRRQRSQSQGPG